LEIARLSGLKAQSGDMLEGFGDAIIGTQTGITEEAIAEFEVAADRAQQAQNGLRLLMNDIMNQPTGPAAGITLGGDGDDDGGGNGGGDGGGGSDPLSDRLVALTESLATEAEIVAEWYAASQDTLMEALEAKQLTEEEYRELRERLEKEHQDRMAGIRDAGESRGLTSAKGFFDGMAAIAQAGGQKTVKIAAAIGAVQGLIDAYGAALKALNSPEPLTIGQRFAAYAGVLAAGLKGVMSIQQAGRSGSAAGAGGAASGATASAAPAMARQNIVIDLVGDTFSGDSVRALFSQINDGLRSGYQIEGVLAR